MRGNHIAFPINSPIFFLGRFDHFGGLHANQLAWTWPFLGLAGGSTFTFVIQQRGLRLDKVPKKQIDTAEKSHRSGPETVK